MPPSDSPIQPRMSHSILIHSQGPVENKKYTTGAEVWNGARGLEIPDHFVYFIFVECLRRF